LDHPCQASTLPTEETASESCTKFCGAAALKPLLFVAGDRPFSSGSWKAFIRFCACIGTMNQIGTPLPALPARRGEGGRRPGEGRFMERLDDSRIAHRNHAPRHRRQSGTGFQPVSSEQARCLPLSEVHTEDCYLVSREALLADCRVDQALVHRSGYAQGFRSLLRRSTTSAGILPTSVSSSSAARRLRKSASAALRGFFA